MKDDPDYLAYIRLLPCLVCGRNGTEAAHVRYADARAGKPSAGIGRKPIGWLVPLCREHHRAQHAEGEKAYWAKQGIDPIFVALALHKAAGNVEIGENIIRHWYFHS